MPNTSPVTVATPKLMMIDHAVTWVGSAASIWKNCPMSGIEGRRGTSQSTTTDPPTPAATPSSPPMAERTPVSTRNCQRMFTGGPDGASDADLARALGDAGEHDVHDADAADEQRDARHGTEDKVVGELCLARVFEQFVGHDDVHVRHARVAHFHDAAQQLRGADHRFTVAHHDVDL